MAVVVSADLILEPSYEMRTLGTRTHNAHVSLQNVDELRQLIETRFSKKCPDPGPARIRLGGPARIALGRQAHSHGAKLIHLKGKTIQAYPLLDEENRPWRRQPNQ